MGERAKHPRSAHQRPRVPFSYHVRMWLRRMWWRYTPMPQPRIVSTYHTLGGTPRLDGTRLSVTFFAAHRNEPREWFSKHWPYVSDAHLALMFATVDAVLTVEADRRAYPESFR